MITTNVRLKVYNNYIEKLNAVRQQNIEAKLKRILVDSVFPILGQDSKAEDGIAPHLLVSVMGEAREEGQKGFNEGRHPALEGADGLGQDAWRKGLVWWGARLLLLKKDDEEDGKNREERNKGERWDREREYGGEQRKHEDERRITGNQNLIWFEKGLWVSPFSMASSLVKLHRFYTIFLKYI